MKKSKSKTDKSYHAIENEHGHTFSSPDPFSYPDLLFVPLGTSLDTLINTYIKWTLSKCNDNRAEAAKLLKVDQKTVYNRMLRIKAEEEK